MTIKKTVLIALISLIGNAYTNAQNQLVEQSKINSQKEYEKLNKRNKKQFRMLDHYNIAGTKASNIALGSYIDDDYFLNSYAFYLSKVNKKKALVCYGAKYMTTKYDDVDNKWYLATITYKPLLFPIANVIDIRLNIGAQMGVNSLDDMRIGKQNTYYALGATAGLEALFKINTWFYIIGGVEQNIIYNTKDTNNPLIYNLGLRFMMN